MNNIDTMGSTSYLVIALSLSLFCWCTSLPTATQADVAYDVGKGLREDAAALLAFRRGIDKDPSGGLRDWRRESNPCGWRGVVCETSSETGEDRVVSLELWGLELEGSISPQIGKLSELRKLALVGNRFSGEIPVKIVNCQKLSTLDLRANGLSGVVGFSLADFANLKMLKLSENSLTGSLSILFGETKRFASFDPFRVLADRAGFTDKAGKGPCPKLEVLDLAQNSLTGSLPTGLGRCGQLVELSLNDNSFNGAIPATLSSNSHLEALLVSRNRLSGTIPSAIAVGCKKLQLLDVAENLLKGHIPAEFAEFRGARQFNFSFNRFEGPIPLGRWSVRQMAADGVFSGNPALCGWPSAQNCPKFRSVSHDQDLSLRTPGSLVDKFFRLFRAVYERAEALGQGLVSAHRTGRAHLEKAFRTRRSMADDNSAPSPTSPKHKNTGRTARKWALGLALGIVAGAIAAALLATILRLCIFYMHKAPYLQGPIIFHPNISPKMLLFLENNESLSNAELVGEGGAGRVYKQQLENGMVVAVKSVPVKEDQKGIFGQKQIQAELETLGCIRHRNLVVLLAYVHRPDCHLLLYEYMQNGSLHHALQKINTGELDMPWPVRHKIAVGTSQGLSYLHFHSNPRIVHRDLKPSNILLDSNFVAHVSDFGLAKVIPGDDTHVTTGVAGTVGYIAPEYSQTCRFTDKSDVYAFGVVLAVLLTGKDPTDQFFHTVAGGSIGSWLHDLLQKGNGRDAIDPKIRQPEFEEETLLAMKIAVFCTHVNPSERPASKEILIMLNQIRNVEGTEA